MINIETRNQMIVIFYQVDGDRKYILDVLLYNDTDLDYDRAIDYYYEHYDEDSQYMDGSRTIFDAVYILEMQEAIRLHTELDEADSEYVFEYMRNNPPKSLNDL